MIDPGPAVQAALAEDGGGAQLRLASGAMWRLRASGAEMSLGDSIYLGSGEARKTQQVVLTGTTGPSGAVVRWAIQRGDIVCPKSTRTERMQENFDLFDFELTDDQVTQISGLDRGEEGRTGPNPDAMDWIPS